MSSSSVIRVTANTLAGIALFRELSEDDRSLIAQYCRGKRYSPHQQILSQKDPSRDVYFIISGTVRVTYFSKSGKEISFRDQSAGEMFGELSAIDGLPRSAQIWAQTDAVLVSVNQDHFLDLLHNQPSIADKVMRHLTNLVRLLSDRVVEFSALGVNNRIHAELLRLAKKVSITDGSASITPVPTHVDIANRVSTHREAVTRELNELEHKGLIERKSDVWIIHDIERLHRIVHDVLGE